MYLSYRSGEEIKKGARVTYHGDPGEVEFVAAALTGEPDVDWHVTELGPGVMLIVPKSFGTVFITDTANDEDLIFICRRSST